MIPVNKKKFPKKIIIASSIVAAVLVASVTYVYAFNGNIFGWRSHQESSNTSEYNPATPEQQQSGTDIKDDTVNEQEDASKPTTGTDTPTSPVDQGSAKSTITVDITSVNQTSSTYQIRTLIGAVTNDGECNLSLARNGTVISKTSQVSALAKTSTCQGFDIPMSDLTAGTWQLSLTFSNTSLTGSVTKSIVIQ